MPRCMLARSDLRTATAKSPKAWKKLYTMGAGDDVLHHETSKGKKVEVTKENNAEFNRPVPKNSEGGHQKVAPAPAPVAKRR